MTTLRVGQVREYVNPQDKASPMVYLVLEIRADRARVLLLDVARSFQGMFSVGGTVWYGTDDPLVVLSEEVA